MAKVTITHSCGHEERHALYGRASDRKWLEKTLSERLCGDCYEADVAAKREAAAAQAEADAREVGLPELVGTPKQVTWALQLRAEFMAQTSERFREIIAKIARNPFADRDEGAARLRGALQAPGALDALHSVLETSICAIAAQHTNASYWIDNRRLNLDATVEAALNEVFDPVAERGLSITDAITEISSAAAREIAEEKVAASEAAQADAEATIRPENDRGPAAARVVLTGNNINVSYPDRSDALLAIVHRYDSEWDHAARVHQIAAWVRPRDCAAQLAHELLTAGFRVIISDENLREMAASGNYTPWTGRVIANLKDRSAFTVRWLAREDWFNAARRIPAYYKGVRHQVSVSPARWQELEDFAQAHGFEFTSPARRWMGELAEIEASILPQPIGPAPEPDDEAEPPAPTAEVPEHLMDSPS